MKLFNKIYNWFFIKERVEIVERPIYISCSDLFIKH